MAPAKKVPRRPMLSDLKFALRQLAKTPGFSAVTLLTMAVGIGATATTFSWIRPLLFNPLPGTTDSSRLVAVENVAGVKAVHDHLVWVEPMSAMAFPSPEDEAKERAAAAH